MKPQGKELRGTAAPRSGIVSRFFLLSTTAGPWWGPEYLQALGSVAGAVRLGLLSPQPLKPRNARNRFRIGMAQAYFKSQESATRRPSESERDLIRSLPYQ